MLKAKALKRVQDINEPETVLREEVQKATETTSGLCEEIQRQGERTNLQENAGYSHEQD